MPRVVPKHFCGKRLLLLLIWRSGAELTNQLQMPRVVPKHFCGKRLQRESKKDLPYFLSDLHLQVTSLFFERAPKN